jgi:hypothetical protein
MKISFLPIGMSAVNNAYLPDRKINNRRELVNTGMSLVALRNQQINSVADTVSFSSKNR